MISDDDEGGGKFSLPTIESKMISKLNRLPSFTAADIAAATTRAMSRLSTRQSSAATVPERTETPGSEDPPPSPTKKKPPLPAKEKSPEKHHRRRSREKPSSRLPAISDETASVSRTDVTTTPLIHDLDSTHRELLRWQRKARDADDAALVMKQQMQAALGQLVDAEQRLQQQHQDFMDWHRQEMDATVVQYEADLLVYREEVRCFFIAMMLFAWDNV